MYGENVTRHQILNGKVTVPPQLLRPAFFFCAKFRASRGPTRTPKATTFAVLASGL